MSEFKTEAVRCSCGGNLIPTYLYQKVKEKNDDFEQVIHIEWKCENCGKVVKK